MSIPLWVGANRFGSETTTHVQEALKSARPPQWNEHGKGIVLPLSIRRESV